MSRRSAKPKVNPDAAALRILISSNRVDGRRHNGRRSHRQYLAIEARSHACQEERPSSDVDIMVVTNSDDERGRPVRGQGVQIHLQARVRRRARLRPVDPGHRNDYFGPSGTSHDGDYAIANEGGRSMAEEFRGLLYAASVDERQSTHSRLSGCQLCREHRVPRPASGRKACQVGIREERRALPFTQHLSSLPGHQAQDLGILYLLTTTSSTMPSYLSSLIFAPRGRP